MKHLILCLLLTPQFALAWGKRGHQIVGETAARLAAGEAGAGFLKERSFDFGFYANVPDFIWKRPASYEVERHQHFMDMEHFDRAFKNKPEVKAPFKLSRAEFEAKFPEVKESSGRAYWRVREMVGQLAGVTKSLRELEAPSGKKRQALQEKWLVLAGTLGHYVGDLAQPLHITENYDGQITGQKGVHSFFEEEAVEQLYPGISAKVDREAARQWPAFKKMNSKKTVLELLEQLTANSSKALPRVLKQDKAVKRDSVGKYAGTMESLIAERLVEGSLTLAEIYRRHLDWKFDGKKFYFFDGEPDYIKPGGPVGAG